MMGPSTRQHNPNLRDSIGTLVMHTPVMTGRLNPEMSPGSNGSMLLDRLDPQEPGSAKMQSIFRSNPNSPQTELRRYVNKTPRELNRGLSSEDNNMLKMAIFNN